MTLNSNAVELTCEVCVPYRRPTLAWPTRWSWTILCTGVPPVREPTRTRTDYRFPAPVGSWCRAAAMPRDSADRKWWSAADQCPVCRWPFSGRADRPAAGGSDGGGGGAGCGNRSRHRTRPRSPAAWWPTSPGTCSRAACPARPSATCSPSADAAATRPAIRLCTEPAPRTSAATRWPTAVAAAVAVVRPRPQTTCCPRQLLDNRLDARSRPVATVTAVEQLMRPRRPSARGQTCIHYWAPESPAPLLCPSISFMSEKSTTLISYYKTRVKNIIHFTQILQRDEPEVDLQTIDDIQSRLSCIA